MSDEGPKLYVNKPKKAQRKKHIEQQPPPTPSPASLSLSSKAGQSATAAYSSLNVPSPPPRESFARRYKFLWPLLLTVNFSVGAYLFMRTKKKDNIEGDVPADTSPPTSAVSTASVKLPEPIPKGS